MWDVGKTEPKAGKPLLEIAIASTTKQLLKDLL
jgi:hypothetical protein